MTLQDVAERAGVHVATASCALNPTTQQHEVGAEAARALLRIVEEDDRPARSVELMPELVVRGSTAPPLTGRAVALDRAAAPMGKYLFATVQVAPRAAA